MSDSVAIVTGASSGIGKATALRLARAFTNVVVAARAGEQLAAVAETICSLGSTASSGTQAWNSNSTAPGA